MDAAAFGQGVDDVRVGADRLLQINTVHEADVVGKRRINAAVHRIFKRCLDVFQIAAQVVALGGDVEQLIVDIDSRAVDDLITGRAQDGVGDLALGHRLVADGKRVGRVDIPACVLHRRAGGLQHTLGRVDTGLHVLTGVFKHLLALHVTDVLAVHLHIQHKAQPQPAAHQDHKPRCGNCREYVSDGVPDNDGVFSDAAGKVFFLGTTHIAILALHEGIGDVADMADARGHPHERAGQVLNQRDNTDQNRAQDNEQQIQHGITDAAHNSPHSAAYADKNILDPEADHVQHIADSVAAVQVLHITGCLAAIIAALFFLR